MIEKIRKWVKDKTGVSPIIAIILMVAITVVLAATIYVWVTGFGTKSKGVEEASATCQLVGTDTLKFTLTKAGGNGSYTSDEWSISIYNVTDSTAVTISSTLADNDGDGMWDVGESVYVSGLARGKTYSYTVQVKGTTILDGEIYIP